MITINLNMALLYFAIALNLGFSYLSFTRARKYARDLASHKANVDYFNTVVDTHQKTEEACNEALHCARLAVMVHVTGDAEMKYDLVQAAQEFSRADAEAAKSIGKVVEFKRR